jgi:pyrimidine operon attenuation protein/uracil phosphoribosyltransferase
VNSFPDLDVQVLSESLASQIVEIYPDPQNLVLVGVLSNGYPLAERISHLIEKKTSVKTPVGKLDISLYRDDLTLRGEFITVRESDIPFRIDDKILILIDDVLFHGRTVRAALNALLDFGRPAKIELGVLIDRLHVQLPIFAHYVGQRLCVDRHDHIHVSVYEIDGEDKITLERSTPIT